MGEVRLSATDELVFPQGLPLPDRAGVEGMAASAVVLEDAPIERFLVLVLLRSRGGAMHSMPTSARQKGFLEVSVR